MYLGFLIVETKFHRNMAKDRRDELIEEISKLLKELKKCTLEIQGKIDKLEIELATIAANKHGPF
jgi:uncharacterized protein YydD (DUF2326 family)